MSAAATVNTETGEITDAPTTSISAAAARLALSCVLGSGEGHPLDRVLVETEYCVASDSRRLLIVGEPDAENGLFVRKQRVGTVSAEALKDAVRGAARVHVSTDSLASLDEDGATVRVVPFVEADATMFPDWRPLVPPRQPTVARFNPALVCDVLRLLAQHEVTEVKLSMGSMRDPLVFEAELKTGAPVTLVVMPMLDQQRMPEALAGDRGRIAGMVADLVPPGGGIDSVTMSSGGRSVTITQEDAKRIRANADTALKRTRKGKREASDP